MKKNRERERERRREREIDRKRETLFFSQVSVRVCLNGLADKCWGAFSKNFVNLNMYKKRERERRRKQENMFTMLQTYKHTSLKI